jgi:uncharacterized membrane protein
METGAIYSLISALAFAITQVMVRRATHQSEESFTAMAATLFVGAPLFLVIVVASGTWRDLWAFSWQGFVYFAAAGILQFVGSRFMYFSAIRLIGANMTVAASRISVLISVIFGILFLHESVTPALVTGALLIMFGAMLVSI